MTSIAAPGGESVYFRQAGAIVQFSYDESSWDTLTFPVTVTNQNTAAGLLTLTFTTDLTLPNNNCYFVCNSSHIQFGREKLLADGYRPVLTVQANNYDGLIQNGTELLPGFNNINVFNLVVDGGANTTQVGAGWIGMSFFGIMAVDNYIVNCESSGTIGTSGGGILGRSCGSGAGASLILRGCSSYGTIGASAGGIVGQFAGQQQGSVSCDQCFAFGAISANAGGIFGANAAQTNGSATALTCYTLGIVAAYAGGIFGDSAGNQSGQAIAQFCYSQGSIGAFGGGIFAGAAGQNNATCSAINCYSSGTLITPGTGIFGSNAGGGISTTACYVAEGSWNAAAADAALQNVPTPPSTVGITWVEGPSGKNFPYELNNIGATPYSEFPIDDSFQLQGSFAETVAAGSASSAALAGAGNTFAILALTGGDAGSYNTITMNASTGQVSTTSSTVAGKYGIVLRSASTAYAVTTFELTVTASPPPPPPPSPSSTAVSVSVWVFVVLGIAWLLWNLGMF